MTAEMVDALRQTHSNAIVTRRDLRHEPPPFVTEDWQNGAYTPEEHRTLAQMVASRYSNAAIDELTTADILLIGAPMHNLTVFADLKAWLDQIIRINKTFPADYTGLATGKKCMSSQAEAVVTARARRQKNIPFSKVRIFVAAPTRHLQQGSFN